MATLVNGLLEIKGTINNDTITVRRNGSLVWVVEDEKQGNVGSHGESSFDATKIKSVRVYGYEGNDVISLSGLKFPAEIRGGPGNDTIRGGQLADKIYGQGNKDTLYGNEGNDYLNGGDDNDTLNGNAGDDTLYGEAGNDTLNGNAGRDNVYGYTGKDTIHGVFGEDKALKGNADNDTLHMTFNLDSFYRYKGYDTFAEGISGVDTFYVTMDLGTTGRDLIGRFIGQVQQFTNKLQPIANLLNTSLPLPDNGSSPTLGRLLGGNYQRTADLISAVNQFSASSFRAGSFKLGTFKVDSNFNVTRLASGALGSQAFAGQLSRLSKYLDVSFLTDATKAFKIAMNFDNIDLFRLDLGSYAISTGRLNQYLGTYPVGPVPVSLNLVGSMNLKLGGSIVYDVTGLRENNLIRGLKLSNARAELSVPVGIEATVGGTFTIAGQTFTPGVGGGGEVEGVVTVSTGNVRLGSGQSVSSKISTSGRLNYRLYLFATYPEAYFNNIFDNGIRWTRAESNVFDGSLPM